MKCEKNIGGSNDPLPVVETPRLPGSLRDQLSLEANAVWTDCMLEALAMGVKGGKWYSLMDKVWDSSHLTLGAWAVIRNEGAPGVDHRSCEQLEENSPARWTYCTANCAKELTGPNLSNGSGLRSRDKLRNDHWGYPWFVIGLSKRRSGW